MNFFKKRWFCFPFVRRRSFAGWKTAITQRNPDYEWQFLFCNFEIINLTVSPLMLLRPRLIFPP